MISPENTVFDIKRLIGRKYSDKSVQADKKLVPYKIVAKNDKPYVEVTIVMIGITNDSICEFND